MNCWSHRPRSSRTSHSIDKPLFIRWWTGLFVFTIWSATNLKKKYLGEGSHLDPPNIYTMVTPLVLRVTESSQGERRGRTRIRSADYHVKWNNIQSESELTEDGSITNSHGAAQKHLDQLVHLWQQQECLCVSCKTYLSSSLERFCEVSRVHSQDSYWKSVGVWCGVLSLSHRGTPHTIGAKQLNLGFFDLMFVVSHLLKIL